MNQEYPLCLLIGHWVKRDGIIQKDNRRFQLFQGIVDIALPFCHE